ncbi:hypothetical protein ACHAPO_001260 [Fusarium lateritium]
MEAAHSDTLRDFMAEDDDANVNQGHGVSTSTQNTNEENDGDSDSDIDMEGDDSDSDESGDYSESDCEDGTWVEKALASGYDKQEVTRFLKDISSDIARRHSAPDVGPILGLKQNVSLSSLQHRGVAEALYSKKSRFNGMILADPPGTGKTLIALATIAMSTAKRTSLKGPCVVVTPDSICHQWMEEIDKYFGYDQMPWVYIDKYTSVSPEDVSKSKVVITSYPYVASEFARVQKFNQGMDAYKKGEATEPPERPKLLLLSGSLDQGSQSPMGEWLVLDDALAIRNPNSRTYHAISNLRDSFNGCLMMVSVFNYELYDFYPLVSMLRGHPFTSFLFYKATFLQSSKYNDDLFHLFPLVLPSPKGYFKKRFEKMFKACCLRRPQWLLYDKIRELS